MKSHQIGGFRRFPFLGAVSAILSSLAACGGSGSDTVEASRGYAYIASADVRGPQVPGAVYQFAIAPDGSLAPLSVASVPTGAIPTAMVSDPSGRYVYVVNLGDATISQYAVGAGGGLMALSPAVVDVAGSSPSATAGYSVSIDPRGGFLYVVSTPRDPPGPSASIAQYSIRSDGTLTPLTQPYINIPASASGPLAIDPSGQYAYLAGATSAQVSQFSVASDGTLAPLVPAAVAATQTAVGIVIAPSGQTAYVLSACFDNVCDGQVAQFTIGANGALTPTGAMIHTGSHVIPEAMVIDGSASSAYLLVNVMGVDTNSGSVYQYTIDSTGALVPGTPNSLSVTSGAVAESVYGSNLYALSSNAIGFASGSFTGGHFDHYAVESNGNLTMVGTTPLAASLPTAMTLVVAH
jgi:6-phosphogluconolactonase